jgi:hypothetical protein
VRDGVVDFETAMGFATNAGNFRLEMQDYLEGLRNRPSKKQEVRSNEMEIERF